MSQRHLGHRFGVSLSTVSRHLKKRTSVRIYKRKSAPKYKNDDQQQRAKSNCLKLYKKLSPGCQLILDNEKYFTLSSNVPGNSRHKPRSRKSSYKLIIHNARPPLVAFTSFIYQSVEH